jgi:hypothetical protein
MGFLGILEVLWTYEEEYPTGKRYRTKHTAQSFVPGKRGWGGHLSTFCTFFGRNMSQKRTAVRKGEIL